jgi:hypothetical protein
MPQRLVTWYLPVSGDRWPEDYERGRPGGGILGHCHAEVAADLHALQDEIDPAALLPLHVPQAGPYVIFLADAFSAHSMGI